MSNHITDDKRIYDSIVVGAGITGIGVFRDLALHGEKVLLIDKGNFCEQTSAKSSKLLHGGVRYLEQWQFSLVREALREKKLWLHLTPDLCQEQSFYFPIYKNTAPRYYTLKMGLMLYDFLAGKQQTTHKMYKSYDLLKIFPSLKKDGLIGAGVYSDAIMDDRGIGIRCLEKTLSSCPLAVARKGCELVSVHYSNTHNLTTVNIKDQQGTQTQTYRCKNLIFCTGPFTDEVMKKLNIPWNPQLILSKGSHLWLDPQILPELRYPLVMRDQAKRVIFVIPHGDKILLGTTETDPGPELSVQDISEEETQYLCQNLMNYFPHLSFASIEKSIIGSFAGVRPLVIKPNSSPSGCEKAKGEVSRFHQIYQPQKNCWVLIGGKYTTFRAMAADLVQKIYRQNQKRYNPNLTKQL